MSQTSHDDLTEVIEFTRAHPTMLSKAQLWADICDQPPMMTAKEVAAFLRLDQPTAVYDLLRAGDLTGLRIGRQWIVPRGVVAEFIIRRSHQS